jgi:hypothetical protein
MSLFILQHKLVFAGVAYMSIFRADVAIWGSTANISVAFSIFEDELILATLTDVAILRADVTVWGSAADILETFSVP